MKIEDISPSNWIFEVEKQIKELEEYLRNIQNKTSNQEINIRIIKNKGTEQYYLVNKREKSVQYIQKKNIELIKKITQENYYEKIIPRVKKEITFLKKIKEDFQSIDILNYYKNMPEKRKKLITPPTLSDHEYTKKWQQVKYFGKKIDDNEDKYETSWGLKVRSKSEIIIAETLRKQKLSSYKKNDRFTNRKVFKVTPTPQADFCGEKNITSNFQPLEITYFLVFSQCNICIFQEKKQNN